MAKFKEVASPITEGFWADLKGVGSRKATARGECPGCRNQAEFRMASAPGHAAQNVGGEWAWLADVVVDVATVKVNFVRAVMYKEPTILRCVGCDARVFTCPHCDEFQAWPSSWRARAVEPCPACAKKMHTGTSDTER
jgi:hypothetical protein